MKQRGTAGRNKGGPSAGRAGRAITALAIGAILAMIIMASASAAGVTSRVSTDSAGAEGNGASSAASLAAYGRYAVFSSYASNLVPGDTNGYHNLFRKDLQNGETLMVSTSASGVQADGEQASISGDGRFVAFRSKNSALGGTNVYPDIFLKDMVTGSVTMVSTDSDGNEPAAGEGRYPSISTTGRYVAFESNAATLVYGDTNGPWWATDVFVKDTLTGITTRVSTNSAGEQAYGYGNMPTSNSSSGNASISADGRYVAFWSAAVNLAPVDANNYLADIYVKDALTGETAMASTSAAGEQGNSSSFSPDISADGRYVAFVSASSNLVPGDTNGRSDAFVKDMLTGAIRRVSTDSDGNQSNAWEETICTESCWEEDGSTYCETDCNTYRYGNCGSVSLSDDGNFVAFTSNSTNLVPGDTNGMTDAFAKNLLTGETTRISVNDEGGEPNAHIIGPSISGDGSLVSFHSVASNLVADDTNGSNDVFLATTDTCQGTEPSLGLGMNSVYWSDYNDYLERRLSVEYGLANSGANDASGVQIVGSTNSGGVTVASGLPIAVGDITAGSTAAATVKYSVPAGVTSFKTTLYATAADACGVSYSYPGPMPGA